MSSLTSVAATDGHSHIFLGTGHEQNERKTWAVIALCSAMMLVEIIGGSMFGSLALIADGLHMSTHAGAMLIAALAYTYARRHASDSRFVFGTGKLGDLAGFTSAIILAMIALLIGYEAVSRFLAPVPIHFREAIPIACVGLLVNIASAWLLAGGEHHGHSHTHGHAHEQDHAAHGHDSETRRILIDGGSIELSIDEVEGPPHFRAVLAGAAAGPMASSLEVETLRAGNERQHFHFVDRGAYWESLEEIPEPHAFGAALRFGGSDYQLIFEEHAHAHAAGGAQASMHRDNNIRSAYIHVLADAAVSVLAITGLVLARSFGWNWMDPLAGIIGALVIANWSYGLMRDAGRILMDMNPDAQLTRRLRQTIECNGDRIVDLHLWRLGPGHLGAVISIATSKPRDCEFYRAQLSHFGLLSHLTIEVIPQAG
jgi:cation diffusion facilitator family transporter